MKFEDLKDQEGLDAAIKSATDEAVKAAVSTAVDEATSGLSKKNSELLEDVKKAKAAAKAWEGMDAEQVKKMMDHFESDQDLKDIAEGKHSEVIERRLEKQRVEWEAEMKKVTDERDTLRTEASSSTEQVRELLIDTRIGSEFAKQGGLPEALEDVVSRAVKVWQVEKGEPVARDGDKLITGADGPLKVTEWVTNLKAKSPHLFEPSEGAGSSGSGRTRTGEGEPEKVTDENREKWRAQRRKEMAARRTF